MDQMMTAKEVAERLKVSRRYIGKQMASGKLPYVKLGTLKNSKILFATSDVEAFLASMRSDKLALR